MPIVKVCQRGVSRRHVEEVCQGVLRRRVKEVCQGGVSRRCDKEVCQAIDLQYLYTTIPESEAVKKVVTGFEFTYSGTPLIDHLYKTTTLEIRPLWFNPKYT